jgi:hypothetical protein
MGWFHTLKQIGDSPRHNAIFGRTKVGISESLIWLLKGWERSLEVTLQTHAADSFRSCRWGAKRRVLHARPPLAWAHFLVIFLFPAITKITDGVIIGLWNFECAPNKNIRIVIPKNCHTRSILKFPPSLNSCQFKLSRWSKKWYYNHKEPAPRPARLPSTCLVVGLYLCNHWSNFKLKLRGTNNNWILLENYDRVEN